jgi:hypothetical protein
MTASLSELQEKAAIRHMHSELQKKEAAIQQLHSAAQELQNTCANSSGGA